MTRMQKLCIIFALALGLTGVAHVSFAQFYIGGGVGPAWANIDDNAVNVAGATASSLSKEERDIGWKLFGGYEFNKNFALELGYFKLGGQFQATRTVTAPFAGAVNYSVWSSGGFLDVVGTLPIGHDFSLIGRAGGVYSSTNANIGLTGALGPGPGYPGPNPKASEWGGKLGLGLQYDFTKSVGMRAEWERYFKIGDSSTTGQGDVDVFGFSLMYKF
jgi:OOP family OmpA-OmpF porin